MMKKGFNYGPQPSAEDKAKFIKAGKEVMETYANKSSESAQLVKLQLEFMKKLGY